MLSVMCRSRKRPEESLTCVCARNTMNASCFPEVTVVHLPIHLMFAPSPLYVPVNAARG